tara:strand:+ start:96 stop:380 length:285 start_codon:yes stop_codon:yes gene_type:complete
MVAYLLVLGLVLFTLVLRLITAREIKKQQEEFRQVDNYFSDLSSELDYLDEEIHSVQLISRQYEIRRSRLSGDIENLRSKLKSLQNNKGRRAAA